MTIQIHDLSFEEDLSYDELSNIAGGQEESGGAISQLVNDVLSFAQDAVNAGFATAQQAIDGAYQVIIESVRACAASSDPTACLAALDTEI